MTRQSADDAWTTMHITLPVGRDDPLLDDIAEYAMRRTEERDADAFVTSETIVSVICSERFEPDMTTDRTHSCSLTAGHDGAHVCGLCSEQWERPNG